MVSERPGEDARQVPAGSRGSARRHRVEGGRRREVRLRYTDAEYDALAARAAAAGVSVQRFLTEAGFAAGRPVGSSLAAELAALRRLTAAIGNNLNQIARALNATGRPDPGVTAAAGAVVRLVARIDVALGWLGVPPQRNAPGTAPA